VPRRIIPTYQPALLASLLALEETLPAAGYGVAIRHVERTRHAAAVRANVDPGPFFVVDEVTFDD
jgi:hypothetical protein